MYQITTYYDGKLFSSHVYNNCLDAVNDFNLCTDSGIAKETATYNLLEPSGKMHTRNFNKKGLVSAK